MFGHESVAKMADLRTSADNFAEGAYENPMTWQERQKFPTDQLTIDPLFENLYRKSVVLDQYGDRDHPEYIKWKIFGHNLVICYEYISKGEPDKALEIIDDIENLLKSIGNNDSFLKSIKIAMDHVTFSMKGDILKLCSLETELENFVMPLNMNYVNKSGLFGIQALFLYYKFDFLCVKESKYSLLKAISLNDTEAEWYFLIAKVLHDASMNCNNDYYVQYCKEEFEMSKKAFELGGKVQHKLHLVNSYYRMNRLIKVYDNSRNQNSSIRIKLINETMDETNDLLLFKSSLNSLSNIGDQANFTKQRLLNKLESSNCGYVQNVIGKYYLNTMKDYEKALFHLKKAIDGNSFFGNFDYIETLLKINGDEVPVEKMLVDMLNKFLYPTHQQKILSQIVSHKVIIKRDIIGALDYILMLLRIKNISCINLQNHKMLFSGRFKQKIDLLMVLSEKLDEVHKKNISQTLSTDNMTKVAEVLNALESVKLSISNCMRPKESNFEKKFSNDESKKVWLQNKKQNVTSEKNIDRENWRTLNADSSNSNSFKFNYKK